MTVLATLLLLALGRASAAPELATVDSSVDDDSDGGPLLTAAQLKARLGSAQLPPPQQQQGALGALHPVARAAAEAQLAAYARVLSHVPPALPLAVTGNDTSTGATPDLLQIEENTKRASAVGMVG